MVAMTDHERTIPTSGHIAAEHAVPTCARMKTIAVPDFEVLFADYKGSKPQEDEFVKVRRTGTLMTVRHGDVTQSDN